MKSIWKMILDGLTYQDLAGKRQLRAYTIITGLILLLLLMVVGMAGLNRILLMRAVRNTASLATSPSFTQSPGTIQTESPPLPALESCPTDSGDWSFTPTYTSKNYNVIQPACVYQGLEKTIAWALAVREGYSRAEATRQLGFAEMPMRQLDTVTIPADAKGLADVPVSFIPSNPDFTEWRMNANGTAAVTYALRGCFRTSTVVGNRVEIWGGEYAAICLVVEDAENTHIVYALNGHTYTSAATPMRSFLLFGYLSDGYWVWLGTKEDPKLEITDPAAYARERLTIATLYDSYPWDADWLLYTHQLIMQPPPENWLSLRDESEKQAILDALSTASSGTRP